jgi:hypothetical protein
LKRPIAVLTGLTISTSLVTTDVSDEYWWRTPSRLPGPSKFRGGVEQQGRTSCEENDNADAAAGIMTD